MVLWNDGHKSIKNKLNIKLFPLESSLLLTYPRIALCNQPDGEQSIRSQEPPKPAWSTVATTFTKPQHGAIHHNADAVSTRTHCFYAADSAEPAEPALTTTSTTS
jgi:hypothetical protein